MGNTRNAATSTGNNAITIPAKVVGCVAKSVITVSNMPLPKSAASNLVNILSIISDFFELAGIK